MQRFRSFFFWVLQNFGPIIVFLVVKNIADLKTAIVATLIWSLAEVVYVVGWKREKPSQFFWFSVVTTVAFGVLDLYSANPFLFKYEPVLNNILTAMYFGATIFIGKPIIQEFAERAKPEGIEKPGAKIYLRYLTMAWTLYFIVKAAFYFYLARSPLSFEEATAIRSVVGPVSMGAMLVGEKVLRSSLIKGLKRVRLLPA